MKNSERFSSQKDDDLEQKSGNLSEYEKMVIANIEERKRFLEELNIDEAKASLQNVIPAKKSKVISGIKVKRERNHSVVRRSQRLKLIDPVDFFALPEIEYLVMPTFDEEELPDPGPKQLHTYSQVENENLMKFEKSLSSLQYLKGAGIWSYQSKRLKEVLSEMKNHESLVAKVVSSKIYSLKIHPSVDKTLILAGSKSGDFGIWDACKNEEDGFYNFKIHANPINCMSIDRFNPEKIYTNSYYDGSLRRLELNTTTVEQIYSCDENYYISWHSQRNANTFVISGSNGFVDFIDTRETKIPLRRFSIDAKKSVKLVAVHPVEENWMATGISDGTVALWDLKNMKSPLSKVDYFRTISGLEFSPVSGQHLISTSSNNCVCVIQCQSGKLEVKKLINHDNQTRRWSTTFRPCFLPGSDSHFVIGSMEYPRKIEVYHLDGSLVHSFRSEHLTSVSSVSAFHPHKKIVAGGNLSGKVFIFQDEPELFQN